MHEVLEKNTRDERMFLAAIQGIDTSDMYEDSGVDSKPVNMTQDEYDKILEADREWKKKKQEALESGEAQQAELSAIGLGYTVSGT